MLIQLEPRCSFIVTMRAPKYVFALHETHISYFVRCFIRYVCFVRYFNYAILRATFYTILYANFMRHFIRDFTQYFTWYFPQYLTWYFTRCFTILANTYKNTNKFNTRTKLTIRTNHSHTRKTWLNAYANRRCPTACIAQTAIGKSKVMHQSIVECSVSQNKADCSTCHCACTMCRSCHCVCCMHAAAVSLSLRVCCALQYWSSCCGKLRVVREKEEEGGGFASKKEKGIGGGTIVATETHPSTLAPKPHPLHLQSTRL